jgi:hypothetical protein
LLLYRASSKRLPRGVRFSSVEFRVGGRGDWRKEFSRDDLAFFLHKAGEVNRELGYEDA